MLVQRAPRQRAGFTLTEVLIAIFVMAIGMISLFVLFPFGALKMMQAIKDDKCAYAADNAHVHAVLFWKNVWTIYDAGTHEPRQRTYDQAKQYEQALQALDDPNDTAASYTGDSSKLTGFTPPFTRSTPATNPEILNPFAASYPLYIDPIGWESYRASGLPAGRDWIGGQGGTGAPYRQIPRRTLWAFNPFYTPMGETPLLPALRVPAITRATSLIDDIGFTTKGNATDPSTGFVERGNKYSWSYIIRREQYASPHEVHLTVLVFQDRNASSPAREEVWQATFSEGSTFVSVNTGGGRPFIRKGGFIMDASRYGTYQEAKFFRVANITEANATTWELELDRPWKNPLNPPVAPAAGGIIYVFDTDTTGRLAEVFDRGLISPTCAPLP